MKLSLLLLLPLASILYGCSATPPPDFPKNAWRPLNDLPEKATPIALRKQHVYQVVQLDTTLKGLLERWAEESNMVLLYDHTHDYTLFKQVKNIKQPNLQNALQELSNLYSDKDMVIYIDNGVVVAHKKIAAAVPTKIQTAKNKKRLGQTKSDF